MSDIKPEQNSFNGDERLPPSSEFWISENFSINSGNPVNLKHRDSCGTETTFYEIETQNELKRNVKVHFDGPIIRFSFETCPIDGISRCFSYSFLFSHSFESKFELGNPLKSMPILLPLDNVLHHLCFRFFYYTIQVPMTADCYEIYIVQASDSSDRIRERKFRQGDKIIQKIVCTSGIPSIQRDSATGHFFVAGVSYDPNSPISIEGLKESNLLIHFPDPVDLLENGTLVSPDLSIPFDSEKCGSKPFLTMLHLSKDMYLFQTSIHPTIHEICIVRSSPPDPWRPQQTKRYFGNGDIIVKKICLRTPNPISVLRIDDTSFMLGTGGNCDFPGYRLTL